MKKTLLPLTLFLLFVSATFGQVTKDLNIDFMLRGQLYAQSSIPDTFALGGFGGSDNIAKKISDSLGFVETGLFLKIDTSKLISIEQQYNGYRLFLGNKSDSIVILAASDSRLSVIAEVYYRGRWKPIEYLPSSWCGNSYHKVYLLQNEYWQFDVPKFSGKIKTKLRYRLILSQDRSIYSNVIVTHINKGQLSKKQGHTPNGIMDPYND